MQPKCPTNSKAEYGERQHIHWRDHFQISRCSQTENWKKLPKLEKSDVYQCAGTKTKIVKMLC